MKIQNIVRWTTIAAAVALLCTVNSAHAALQMRITSTAGGTVTIDDNMAGDSNGAIGAITFIGGVSGYTLQVNTGVTKPIIGSAANPEMDLNYVVTKTTAGAETLTIEFSDQGFTTSPTALSIIYSATSNGATQTGLAGTGLNDALYNTSDASTTIGPFAAPGGFGTSVLGVPLDPAIPYSLSLVVTVASTGPSQSSGDLQLTGVPEPASLAVWSVLGLAGLGYGGWRRKRASA